MVFKSFVSVSTELSLFDRFSVASQSARQMHLDSIAQPCQQTKNASTMFPFCVLTVAVNPASQWCQMNVNYKYNKNCYEI